MNKSIEDVVRDFALVDRSSIPSLLLVLATRECYTSMEEVIDGIESDDMLNESHSSFGDEDEQLINSFDDKDERLNGSF